MFNDKSHSTKKRQCEIFRRIRQILNFRWKSWLFYFLVLNPLFRRLNYFLVSFSNEQLLQCWGRREWNRKGIKKKKKLICKFDRFYYSIFQIFRKIFFFFKFYHERLLDFFLFRFNQSSFSISLGKKNDK